MMSSPLNFKAALAAVANRGRPSHIFLTELVLWARHAADEIFLPNDKIDIYSATKNELGPWVGLLQRKAGLMECLRVLAMFESSGNFNEGVDVTNKTSLAHITGQETGVFQVSFDSLSFDRSLVACALRYCGDGSSKASVAPEVFIERMKSNHQFAFEYAARLLRFTTRHNGPVLRREINRWLSRAAAAEFQALLVQA